MALDALWAVLIPEVSEVSEVQAPVYAGFTDTPAVSPGVSGVSGMTGGRPDAAMMGGMDTPDTPLENVRYLAQPAWALGCTLDTPDTPEKINADIQTTEAGATRTLTLSELKRLFRKRGPWLTDTEQTKARAYHSHHFNCHTCIAAGRGIRYGRRCAVGLALWIDYADENNLQTESVQHGQA